MALRSAMLTERISSRDSERAILSISPRSDSAMLGSQSSSRSTRRAESAKHGEVSIVKIEVIYRWHAWPATP